MTKRLRQNFHWIINTAAGRLRHSTNLQSVIRLKNKLKIIKSRNVGDNYLNQVQITFLRIATKVMPHQIIEHTLSHTLAAQVSSIHQLIAPFYPTSCSWTAIYQAEGINLGKYKNNNKKLAAIQAFCIWVIVHLYTCRLGDLCFPI